MTKYDIDLLVFKKNRVNKNIKEYSQERICQLRLIRTSGIGSKTFFELLKLYGSAIEAIFQIQNKKEIFSEELVLKEISEAEKMFSRYIFWDEDEYPKLLLGIQNFPPALNVSGDISHLNKKEFAAIAVVGSRNASASGKKFTEYISRELALRNCTIVSGMANGIDSSAHEAVLTLNLKRQNNEFKTIAVVGSGLQNPYPSQIIAKKILNNGGGIISEFSFFDMPKKENFPIRNRILSGISHATLVIEAAEKSGSILTAKYAIEQNRLVFAVPGFPFDEKSGGANSLIKDGAILVRDVYDVLNEIDQFSFINQAFKQPVQKKIFNEGCDSLKIFDSEPENESDSQQISIENAILKILDTKIPASIEEIIKILNQDYNLPVVFSGIIRILTSMELEDFVRKSDCGGFLKNSSDFLLNKN